MKPHELAEVHIYYSLFSEIQPLYCIRI